MSKLLFEVLLVILLGEQIKMERSPFGADSLENYLRQLSITAQSNHTTRSSSSNVQTSTVTFKTLKVKDIHFTQNTVSATFDNGTMLANVVGQLFSGALKPHDIPAIRVVYVGYLRRWFTLDNRRLRVFKNANIEEINVIECQYSDPQIKQEFETKKTNKSIEGGGEIRNNSFGYLSSIGSAKHFDEGTYVFTKKVLSWTFAQLEQPDYRIKSSEPLPAQFYDREHYYNGFPHLILEEARSILQRGLELAKQNKAPVMSCVLFRLKMPKKADNPATMYFNCINQNKFNDYLVKSADMLLITNGNLKILGMANYIEPTEGKMQICAKVVIDEDTRLMNDSLFNTHHSDNKPWTIYVLGSLITQLRMYDVCLAKPQSPFEKQIINGNIAPPSDTNYSTYGFIYSSFLSRVASQNVLPKHFADQLTHLNTSQREAVEKFILLDQGIQLIQGPPGTGKTTTINQLLKIQIQKSDRILVSAPSNKAVHILAERFLRECPHVPMILAGVEDKLPEASPLQEIFVHTWKKNIQYDLTTLFNRIKSLEVKLPNIEKKEEQQKRQEVIISDTQIILWKKILEVLDGEFELLARKIGIYKLSSFIAIDNHQKTLHSQVQHFLVFLNTGTDKSFIPHPQWLDMHRNHIGGLMTTLTHVQLMLQGKDDEELELSLLNSAKVIFATLSVTGRKTFKDMSAVDVLIIDEAGQAVEAETLIPLQTKPKKCLLVGDTKQLPATVISTHAEKLKFDRSLLWRLLEDCKQPFAMLNVQYRMHPEISRWPSIKYYASKLQNSLSTAQINYYLPQLKDAPQYLSPYSFIDVRGQETTGSRDNYSFINQQEVYAIKRIIEHLHLQHKIDISKQVGVITFYKAQAELLTQQLNQLYAGINVQTVDGFQGGESDIIIISFVRANPRGKIGFLNDFRRLNVALTRARFSLIMVGCNATLITGDHDIAELLQDAQSRGKIFSFDDIRSHLVEKKIVSQKVDMKPRAPKKEFHQDRQNTKDKSEKQSKDFNILANDSANNETSNKKYRHNIKPVVFAKNVAKPAAANSQPLHKSPINIATGSSSLPVPPPPLKPPAAPKQKGNQQLKPHAAVSPFKTKLCIFHSKPSGCVAGDKCKFAHGESELHQKLSPHKK